MKAMFLVAAGISAACATAHAQTVTSPQPPSQTAPAPIAAPTAPAAAAPTAETRRRDIKYMEGILTSAVRAGAAELGQRMQIAEPGSVIVTGTARARGIALDGYGVLFDVDVPMMKQSVIWTTQKLIQQDLREKIQALQQIIARTNDADELRRAQAGLRFFSAQLNSVLAGSLGRSPAPDNAVTPVGTAVPSPVSNAAPPPGMASAATVNESLTPVATLDPNELYTDAVKRSLIDAMLNYSVALKLADDEWLTVAARDSEGPLTPGVIDDASTIVIRVKGADLSAFHSNKLTRDEVLKRVDVREF